MANYAAAPASMRLCGIPHATGLWIASDRQPRRREDTKDARRKRRKVRTCRRTAKSKTQPPRTQERQGNTKSLEPRMNADKRKCGKNLGSRGLLSNLRSFAFIGGSTSFLGVLDGSIKTTSQFSWRLLCESWRVAAAAGTLLSFRSVTGVTAGHSPLY